nr:MAG TPA: hypothetical protein [Caudoviricetes sp.]
MIKCGSRVRFSHPLLGRSLERKFKAFSMPYFVSYFFLKIVNLDEIL